MRAPDATRSANFAAGMGFALVTAVGRVLNLPVPKYLLTELPVLSGLVLMPLSKIVPGCFELTSLASLIAILLGPAE